MQEDKELKQLIIQKTIEKKEFYDLNKTFINKELSLYLLQNKKLFLKLKNKYEADSKRSLKSKELKLVVKNLRSRLRKLFGVFYLPEFENAEGIISKITSDNIDENSFELLKLHRSSLERLRYYEEIYDKIFSIIGIKPKIILDLACGYNPFSYFFLKESFQCSPDYICSDLSDKDIVLFNKFFQNANIKGEAFYCDLTADIEIPKKIEADICFLFKALDSLESASKGSSERLLQEINTKYFVISFPTKSIGGNKLIAKSKRAWFFKLLEKLNYSYEEFSIHNEMFIVIKK